MQQMTKKTRRREGDLTVRQVAMLRARIGRLCAGYLPLLDSFIRGRVELTPSRIKAIEILLARAVPVLSSTEISMGDAWEGASEGELVERLRALLQAHPELATQLGQDAVAARDAAVASVSDALEESESDSIGEG